MKIGIVGGTFDPIHLAHVEMGKVAKEQKNLDEIWFMPSKIPPHKREQKISDEKKRLHMVELAIEGIDGFYASDFELQFPHTTYTAETLERLTRERPEDTFFFIMGGDSLFYFEKWYHPDKILQYATILAVSRDGVSVLEMEACAKMLMQKLGGRIEILSMPEMKISSRMLRKKMLHGENVREYLPEKVFEYLDQDGTTSGG